MEEKISKEQMVENIRQKLTETMFWLNQAASVAPDDAGTAKEIRRVIEELERLDLSVSEAFDKADTEKTQEN